MKGKIYLYLFVFTLLLVLFMFVNSKSILESYEKKLSKSENREQVYKDSLDVLYDQNLDLLHFNLEHNDDALSYFEKFGYNTEQLIPKIKDALISKNIYEGDDHPIVPYASMTENRIMINKIQLLNHKWILADFTDGKYWGELVIKYEVKDSDTIDFELLDYLMYLPSN
ncbi:MAG: hydrolase [Flavobacteriaceae bacterium]|nr:hydrolase [Flavobacteriaceae bacterium]